MGLKETLVKVQDVIILIVLIIFFSWLLPPQGVVGFLCLFLAVYYPIFYLKKGSKTFNFQELLKTFKLLLILLVLYYVVRWLGSYGWVGLLIMVLGFAAYKIIRGKKFFMEGVRDIEKRIWGKSLDKKNWEKKKNGKTR